jgi:hypothetical protein
LFSLAGWVLKSTLFKGDKQQLDVYFDPILDLVNNEMKKVGLNPSIIKISGIYFQDISK